MRVFYSILWRIGVVMALLVALVYLIIRLGTDSYITKNEEKLPHVRTAIVLGAGVLKGGELSEILKDRMDTTVGLYEKGLIDVILVTGDDGSSLYNEVNPSRDYLMSKNVPSEAIFLDHAGFDTYSSMYRAREVFLVNKAIIVTQSFHLPRAVFIARKLGIEAYGIPSDQHTYSVKNNIREFLANIKAVVDIMYNRVPKYLGDEIPITGSSAESI